MKSKYQHFDKLGKEIALDQVVAFGYANTLKIGKVIKLNPKMIGIKEIKKQGAWGSSSYNKYPFDIVIVPDEEGIMYVLKNA